MKALHLEFEVSEDAIKNGNSHPESCPIALTLKKLGYNDAHVTNWYITMTDGDKVYSSTNAADIRQWISDFDDGKVMEPITFRVTFNETTYND